MTDYHGLFKMSIAKYGNHEKWDNCEFGGIKTVANTNVGSVGQDFIEQLCKEFEIHCKYPQKIDGTRETKGSWDLEIEAIKFEIKTATEDTNGNYQFNHIRYHRPYDAVLCLGVSPNDLYFGIWSKGEIATGVAGKLVSMEKSANASYKLTKSPSTLYAINLFEEMIHTFCNNLKAEMNRGSALRE